MSKGTVKWFNTKKGYGFIQPESGEKDIFVHITQLEKAGIRRLFDGQAVNYDIYADRDGKPAAGNIRVLYSGLQECCKGTVFRNEGRFLY